jgi:hypothetical protein
MRSSRNKAQRQMALVITRGRSLLRRYMVHKLVIQIKTPPNQQTLEKGSKETTTTKPTQTLYLPHTSDHRHPHNIRLSKRDSQPRPRETRCLTASLSWSPPWPLQRITGPLPRSHSSRNHIRSFKGPISSAHLFLYSDTGQRTRSLGESRVPLSNHATRG